MAVATYNTVAAFFDESGKFKDRKVVCFGGVSSYNEDFRAFAEEWNRLLVRNGLSKLTAKNALNHRRSLSKRNTHIGVEHRIEDLSPFIECIRKYLLVVNGVTIDTHTFKNLPSHFFQTYGNDPVFVSFARSLLKVIEFTPDRDKVSFTCDDEEQTGIVLFRLWRRIKRVFPEARHKMVAITFADDSYVFALQAADLVSGLIRLEAGKRFFQEVYDYGPLFEALTKNPEKYERIWDVQIVFGDSPTLIRLSDSLAEARKKEVAVDPEKQ